MSAEGQQPSGSGQSSTSSEWRQWIASPPRGDTCVYGGWLPLDEAISSLRMQEPVDPKEDPEEEDPDEDLNEDPEEEDPDEVPDEDPEEEDPVEEDQIEEVPDEVQEPTAADEHHEEHHVEVEDWMFVLGNHVVEDELDAEDEPGTDAESDVEFQSVIDEEPELTRPSRPTCHFYPDPCYTSHF